MPVALTLHASSSMVIASILSLRDIRCLEIQTARSGLLRFLVLLDKLPSPCKGEASPESLSLCLNHLTQEVIVPFLFW